MEFQRERLLDLIEYVEATERDRLKTVLDAAQHRGFFYKETDFDGLPGVALNRELSDDVIWLQVERLSKHPPPAVEDAELRCWLLIRDNPESPPKLASEVSASTLAEVGYPVGDPDAPASVRLETYAGAAAIQESFSEYCEGPWARWAEDEQPRRRTIALYNALFALRQLLEGATETPTELVCGIGFSTLLRANQRMCHPLLTVQLEISLNDTSHAIELRPRLEVQPEIEADVLDKMELSSVDEWRTFTDIHLSTLEDEPLSPFENDTFEPVLKRAVALLDPDARYVPDLRDSSDRSIPSVETTLQVSNVFGIFQRERRATQLMEDLRRFRKNIEDSEEDLELPAAVGAVVTDPTDGPRDEDYPSFRGVSTIPGVTSSDGSGDDLFFPKPFNREQVEVVQRLALRPGVVVQGPPGTGKTHTIANIISHYLALGKRVLVTSQKAPALKVLRAQLPAAVRPLAVSLLDSDRDGLKQFQESVDIIAARLQRTKSHELEREISDLDARIDNIHRLLSRVDKEIDGIGRSATAPVILDGDHLEPLKAARELVADISRAEWIEDAIDVSSEFDPQFTDDDIIDLRNSRKTLGPDLQYLGASIPTRDVLPADDAMIATHRDLSQAEALRRQIAAGTLVELADRQKETISKAGALLTALKTLQSGGATLVLAGHAWTEAATATLRRRPQDEALSALEAMRPEVEALSEEGKHFLTRPIALPTDAVDDEKLIEAIDRLAKGGTGIGIVASLFSGKQKARLGSIRLVGETPRTPSDWAEVRRLIDSQLRARRLKLSWNHAVGHSCLDLASVDGLPVGRALLSQLDHLEKIRDFLSAESARDHEIAEILPRWSKSIKGDSKSLELAIQTIESNVLRERLENSESSRRNLVECLSKCDGDISVRCYDFISRNLGNPDVSDTSLRQDWGILRTELGELWKKEEALQTVSSVTSMIEAAGAPKWAEWLRRDPVLGLEDIWTPGDWRERWRLRRLSTWLSRIDRHGRLRALGAERTEGEVQLKQAYERSIELRTWLQLRTKATDSVQSALAAYADAVRRIGRGTGKRAARYRRDARAASDRAKSALPCWIMPHYRVSESLPADLGLFDLVIVDEASQSTVAALPALLRAKQILIVGDDRQVSPELVGRDQTRADELAKRHLSHQVEDYRAALREEQSLYDLGKVVFAGGAIMLTEHFRCVAPIIEFSKAQFYSHRLLPLRLPTASERLDPPLIDIFVEDGYRKGKTNPPEADCIVSEIEKIANDPAMAKRTIGVTTLLGQEQAALIYGRIEELIGTETMERHQIRVGDPTAFQGDERDIMFISLVAEGQDSPLSGTGYEQRFNVAASRARDRMVLVRSVELDGLRQSDKLRRALLEHFRAPFASEGLSATTRRDRCESPFETEMFDMLAERGFRIDTQVPVGNFRIDLVVEGEDDRRLAIECDGDRYHGPEKWPEDMARQRVLERAGWEVWRCFASRFVRDRTGVLDELLSLLSDRGIAPVGVGEGWISRHTEHRRWRTPAADPMVADYEAAEIEADVTGYRPKASDTRPKLEDAAAPARLGETPTTVRETQIKGEGAGPSSDDLGAFRLTVPVPSAPKQVQHPLPLNGFSGALSSGAYVLADFAALGLTPDAELLYDSQYRRTLREMVGHVIRVEGPIYGDILAVRIARAHGKERTGSTIQKLVFDAVGNRFPRSREEDREVFWPEGLAPDAVFPHRPAADGIRSHADTPLAELASLALPLLRVRLSDEEVIQKMADHFTLARIRRATRERFEAALEIAKRAPSA